MGILIHCKEIVGGSVNEMKMVKAGPMFKYNFCKAISSCNISI